MGNCLHAGRPSSSKLHSGPLGSASSPSNPLVTSTSSIQFSVSHPNIIKNGTPSSSGVSSASSSTSAALFKPINETTSNITNSRYQYIAIFDYDARTKDDLSIRKTDLLEITNKKNAAWWRAKNERGQEGWIPSNYVAKRDSLESEPYVFVFYIVDGRMIIYKLCFHLFSVGISNLCDALMPKNS